MRGQSKNSFRVASLFSGCGGLDYGFEKAGFSIVSALDSDPNAVECYNRNFSSTAKQVKIDEFSNVVRNADVVIAGPPCQGFSTGGGYKEEDPRNNLLVSTCQQIARSRVRLAVIENVSALTNKRNQSFLRTALTTLTDAGYFCSTRVYSASEFGVPQRRKRIIIIARLGGAPFTCPAPPPVQSVAVSDVLSSISPLTQSHKPKFPLANSKHAIIARHIRPGQKLCNVRAGSLSVPTWEIPEWYGLTSDAEKQILETMRKLRRRNRKREFGDADPLDVSEIRSEIDWIDESQLLYLRTRGFIRSVGDQFDLKDTFNGKYRRLSLDGLSPTVDTRFGDMQLFVHPIEDRALTVREAARLQGFPDSFEFPSKERDAFRLIGNAVPPPMSEGIAKECRHLI